MNRITAIIFPNIIWHSFILESEFPSSVSFLSVCNFSSQIQTVINLIYLVLHFVSDVCDLIFSLFI